MEEVYQMLKSKLDKMREDHLTEINFDFKDIAKMYQLVCYMMQIKNIVDGCEH